MVYALKQFRHYLLGRSFLLITDHAPLQWLSAQKMEGMLCRWALAMQEYDFQIMYRKGTLNANADALSRCNRSDTHSCAVTTAYTVHSALSTERETATRSLLISSRSSFNLEGACVELLQSRTSMVHNIKIMICCMAIGHAWIIL